MSVLLHAILACAHGPVNTRDTQEMHVTNLHLVCHTSSGLHLRGGGGGGTRPP